MGTSSGVFMN